MKAAGTSARRRFPVRLSLLPETPLLDSAAGHKLFEGAAGSDSGFQLRYQLSSDGSSVLRGLPCELRRGGIQLSTTKVRRVGSLCNRQLRAGADIQPHDSAAGNSTPADASISRAEYQPEWHRDARCSLPRRGSTSWPDRGLAAS